MEFITCSYRGGDICHVTHPYFVYSKDIVFGSISFDKKLVTLGYQNLVTSFLKV